MHTTEEAKHLWCPMVRLMFEPTVSDPLTGFNASMKSRTPASSACVSSRCAMWRWDGVIKMPDKREADTIWPDQDDPQREPKREVTLRGKVTPVPAWAVWVPITGEGDDLSGGYWIEPQERVDAEHELAVATAKASMRGFCGLAGTAVR